MKCKRCGAEIPQGYVYCSVCGKEVQLVPDYNFLEDDMLSDIIQKGVRGTVPLQKQESEPEENRKRQKTGRISNRKKSIYIWSIICVVIVAAVLTLFFVHAEIQKKHDNSYDYQYALAEEYLSEEDYENALYYFNRALELNPSDKKARNQIIAIYLNTGEKDRAITILEEMIADNPKDQAAYQKLIDIYAEDKEYEKIRELCEDVKNRDILELFTDYLVDQPTFSRISGTYTNALNIVISSSKGYDIYYTTDGSDPIENGTWYHNAIPLKEEGTTVISAVTQNAEGIYSEVVKATYTIEYEAPSMPKVTPAGGNYSEPQMITIHVPADCVAYYTWDGSTPTEASDVYTGALEMPEGNQVLSVILVNSVGLKSSVYRVNYIYMPQ